MERLDLSLPLVLDEMDNRVSAAFAAWPERLVLVGADRRIAYPGRPGPWGFSPEEAREQLAAALEPGPASLASRSERNLDGHSASDRPDDQPASP